MVVALAEADDAVAEPAGLSSESDAGLSSESDDDGMLVQFS